jgi:hypothetical protein
MRLNLVLMQFLYKYHFLISHEWLQKQQVSSISANVCGAVGITRNKIIPLGITG